MAIRCLPRQNRAGESLVEVQVVRVLDYAIFDVAIADRGPIRVAKVTQMNSISPTDGSPRPQCIVPRVLHRAAWAAGLLVLGTLCVNAKPLRIVAIGASNTQGWYVGKAGAYPAQLQKLLKAKGVDADVINAGVPFDTTAAMLNRLDTDVPQGTDIVILQPGANDLRFLGTPARRAANIAEMTKRLRMRSIKVIVYDDTIPLRYYALDFIHLTHDGHNMIAEALLPRVMAIIGPRSNAAPKANQQ